MNEISCGKEHYDRNMDVELKYDDKDDKYKCTITLTLNDVDRKEVCDWISSGFEEELNISDWKVSFGSIRRIRNELFNDLRYAEKYANQYGVEIKWDTEEYRTAMKSEEYCNDCEYWEKHDIPPKEYINGQGDTIKKD